MKVKIKVTKEVLEKTMFCGVSGKGKGYVSESCAVAYAIRELIPNAKVGLYTLTTRDLNSTSILWEGISIPLEARNFIKRFDALRNHPELRLYITPIEFDIDIPESWFKDVSIEEVKEILKKSVNLELVNM